MKGLAGDFSIMPLKDLVIYLGNKRLTGKLTLSSGTRRKEVLLHEGQAVSASSNEPREFLGQFLINLGHITEDQFQKAFRTQQETKVYIGKILIMIGLVTEETVQMALSLKIRETLLDALRWDNGGFEFDPSVAPSLDAVELKIDVLDIHREGEFRETAWEAIRAVFPTGAVRLDVVDDKLPDPPKPGTLDARLLELIRAGHSIDEIVLGLHATDFFVYQRLYALYRLEAVVPSQELVLEPDASGATTLETTTAPSELVAQAEALLIKGNLRDAEALALQAADLDCGPEAVAVLRRVEAALASHLKATLLHSTRVPVLTVAPSQVRAMPLSAQEKYLLSRIDGRRDLAGIVTVSPLREIDALKLFQGFIETGLVRLN